MFTMYMCTQYNVYRYVLCKIWFTVNIIDFFGLQTNFLILQELSYLAIPIESYYTCNEIDILQANKLGSLCIDLSYLGGA